MKIFSDNSFNQNTYILNMDNKVIIIDPGYNLKSILEYCKTHKPDMILLTHYHFDHVFAVDDVCSRFNIKAYIHKNDFNLLMNNNVGSMMGMEDAKVSKDNIITFTNQISSLSSLKIINAPGHTEGSCLYIYDNQMFTGDILFIDSYGRSDLPGSDEQKQINTLKLIKQMNPSLHIYPGHGDNATLKHILEFNELLKYIGR